MSDVILCRKCGAENTPGDQFCGSCGTFLEWSGEPVEREPPILAPDPGPTPPAPPQLPPMTGPLACSNCGSGNPETRTFCQFCGERLPRPAEAPASGGPSPTSGGDKGASGAAAGQRKPPSASGGGLPGWLPAMLVLGLVAGIVVVAVAFALRPGDPGSLASAAPRTPGPTFTPTLSPLPSGSVTESVTLTPSGATASSVVGNREMFDAAKAIDGRLDTSWQEGSAEERGEWIEIAFLPARLDYLVVYSGYQLSRDAYLANRRPMDVLVHVDDLPPVAFRLADSEQPQRLDFDDRSGATRVRLEIVTTYDPEATAYEGSPFDDVAISEIRLFGQPEG